MVLCTRVSCQNVKRDRKKNDVSLYHLHVEGGDFLGRHCLRHQIEERNGRHLVFASFLPDKNKESREKVTLGTVNKSLAHKFKVGLSSSFTVGENYFSHLAKNHRKGGDIKP